MTIAGSGPLCDGTLALRSIAVVQVLVNDSRRNVSEIFDGGYTLGTVTAHLIEPEGCACDLPFNVL